MAAVFVVTLEALEGLPPLAVGPESGAVAAFWGRVRNHHGGRDVTGLEYSAYEALAQTEGQAIVEEAQRRFGLDGVRAAHRIGRLGLGEAALVVEAASGHRGEAFEACRWIVDEVKARVPIWKKEFYPNEEAQWLT